MEKIYTIGKAISENKTSGSGSAGKGFVLNINYTGGPVVNNVINVGYIIKTNFEVVNLQMEISGKKPNMTGSVNTNNVMFFIPSGDLDGAIVNITGDLYSSSGIKIINFDTLVSAKLNLLYLLSNIDIDVRN